MASTNSATIQTATKPVIQDPVLYDPSPSFSMFPVKYPELWRLYKLAADSYWTAEEIDLSQDIVAWEKLNDGERRVLSATLAFFSSSDSIVNDNLACNFMAEVALQEAKAFYAFQMAMETVHAETYGLLIDTYIRDKAERERLFNAVNTIPIIGKKAAWAQKWIHSDAPFCQRLFAFLLLEGCFFQGSFATIFFLKERGINMPGLFFSNELISRDESLHAQFAVELHNTLQPENRISEETALKILEEAVELEIEFVTDALPTAILGMNAASMATYIKFTADRILKQLGFKAHYGVINPFNFMNRIGLSNKSSFFEARVAEYARANIYAGSAARVEGPPPADDDF